jgi:hypothetical protein
VASWISRRGFQSTDGVLVAEVVARRTGVFLNGQETEMKRLLVGFGVLAETSNVVMSCISLAFAAKMMVCSHSSSTCNDEILVEKCSSDDENHTSETAPTDEMHVASSWFLAAAG